MTQNQNDNLHRALAYLNTILLGVVVFFTTRIVANIDRLADNVVDLRVEMATVKSAVSNNTKRLEDIESEQSNPKSK